MSLFIRDKAKSVKIYVQAMKHLMIRRPLDANRMEFFAHAEAFAALVQLDFVLVPGINLPDSL